MWMEEQEELTFLQTYGFTQLSGSPYWVKEQL